MLGETLLNAYIDANILLVIGYALWSLARLILVQVGLHRAYATQLKLLNYMVLAIAVCPALIFLLGGWPAQHALNFSDIMVAQYLEGNVDITALQLDSILKLREALVRDFTQLASPLSLNLFVAFTFGFVAFSINAARNFRRLRNSLLDCRQWRRFGRVQLLLCDTALVPFSTRSLTRHYIVIPTVMLGNSQDVRIAISHELQHFRQRDVEWAIVLELLTPLFFWNPVFFLWKRKVSQLREFSCDQTLVARSGIDVRDYCESLLRACGRSLRGGQNFTVISPAVPLVSMSKRPTGLLKMRIIALTSDRAAWSSKKLFGFMILPLAFAVLTTAILLQRPADWSHDRLMLSTIVNLERLDAHNNAVSTTLGIRTR